MAQGKKYDEEIRTKAFVMLGAGQTRSSVAKALNLPYTTVATWEKQWLKEAEKKAQREKNEAVSDEKDTSSTAAAVPLPPLGKAEEGNADEGEPHNPNGYEETTVDGMSLVELRQAKKDKFADDAWRMIDKTRSLLERRLDRAIEDEDKLDALLCEFENIGSEGKGKSLTDVQLRDLYRRFVGLKLEDARSLSTILGTLYDKQALANKEATQILGGGVGLLRWEDM